MTTRDKRITGRISLTALRKATRQIQKRTKRATSVSIELWKFEAGGEEEAIKLFICSSPGYINVISRAFSSIQELNNFIDELKC